MKKLLAFIGISAVLIPQLVFAAYGLTQSADIEETSTQYFSRVDNALLEPGAAATVECWIKMEDIVGGGADAYAVMSKTISVTSQRSFVFKIADDGAGNITMSTQTSSAGTSFDGGTSVSWTSTPSNGTWYHVAWTMSGATEKYYVDGTQMGSNQTSAISSLFDGTAGLTIGSENSATPTDYFDGKMSLCRFWKEARTQTQINNNKCEVLGSTTNLSGEWTLDNTLDDNSGNSLTLTNNGSVPFTSDVPAVCQTASGSGETLFFMLES